MSTVDKDEAEDVEVAARRVMPAEPAWLKAPVTGPLIGVDRQARILRGYVVAQEGPFKTQGRGEFDGKSLRTIVKLANAKDKGLKSRFTHPDLSADGLGKFLGRAKDARMDSVTVQREEGPVTLQAVRADLHLDPSSFATPSGNLGQYILDLAESDPDALSSSLVLQTDEELRRDNHGHPRKDEAGNDLPPLWRPTLLHASDIVDTGDAVDGLLGACLSADTLPDAAVRRAAELMDRVFGGQPEDVIAERALAWLSRYLGLRFPEVKTPRLDALKTRLAALRARG